MARRSCARAAPAPPWHIAGTARPVNGEGAVETFFNALAMTCKPRKPPREELPWAVPKPSHSITLRVHWPSNAVVFITTMPRFRAYQVIAESRDARKPRCSASSLPRSLVLSAAHHFKAQSRPHGSDHAKDRRGDNWNLHAPVPGSLGRRMS